MFRARMYRSLIPVSNSVKDQRTAHSCAKHKLITDKLEGIRGDLVRNDKDWQEWDFPRLVEALRQWVERNPVSKRMISMIANLVIGVGVRQGTGNGRTMQSKVKQRGYVSTVKVQSTSQRTALKLYQ